MEQYISKSALVAGIKKLHGNPFYRMAIKDVLSILDTMQEEPVSEDFENALAEEWKGYNDRGAAKVDALEDNTQELAFAKGFYRGWHYKKEEPVSEDLEEAAEEYSGKSSHPLNNAFKAGAKWQKKQMMMDAIDVTVNIDAGGYPYIPQIEFYDYDKDVPLAKEGDKYKVVLIKEE